MSMIMSFTSLPYCGFSLTVLVPQSTLGTLKSPVSISSTGLFAGKTLARSFCNSRRYAVVFNGGL